MDSVRIAAVQTYTNTAPDMYQANIDYACKAMKEAAANGAHIICFPETFPGPTRRTAHFDPLPQLSEAARETGLHVIFGTSEADQNNPDQQYLTEILLGPDGKTIGKYHRTSPPGPWIYDNGPFWDLNYVADNDLPVFDTELGKIGILICSEVYLPELARVLAIKGAEMIFMPAGTNKYSLRDTWKILIQARAIENLAYTVTCNNLLWDEKDGGLAIIAGPEGEFVESSTESITYMDADLARLRWLRSAEDTRDRTWQGVEYFTKPGIFTQWRRPEIWNEIVQKNDR